MKYERVTQKKNIVVNKIKSDKRCKHGYKLIPQEVVANVIYGISTIHNDMDCKGDYVRDKKIDRLAELEDKIEQGTLIECNPKLIGECVVGIHQYTDGTYAMGLDEENIVIGFCSDGIVTANTTHAYNDYFKHGLYFIDNEEGRAEATNKLKELQNG